MIELRASSLGSCTKAQAAILMGYEPQATPEHVQGWYDRGNEHEDACATAMRGEGWLILNEQEEIELLYNNVRLTGHLDGIIQHDTLAPNTLPYSVKAMVWEAKAPGAWAKFEKAYKTGDWSDPLCHRYAWQISVYMIATGLEALVCCLDGDDIRTFGVEVPPFTLDQIEARVREIAGIVVRGMLPAECSQADYPCPVSYLHEKKEYAEDEELDGLVRMWKVADDKEKWAKAEKDLLRKEIESRYPEGIETAQSKVTVYSQDAPKKYDMDAIESALRTPLTDYLIAGKPSTRVKITRRDDE